MVLARPSLAAYLTATNASPLFITLVMMMMTTMMVENTGEELTGPNLFINPSNASTFSLQVNLYWRLIDGHCICINICICVFVNLSCICIFGNLYLRSG